MQKTRPEEDKKEGRRKRHLVNISVINVKADFIKDKLDTHKNVPN